MKYNIEKNKEANSISILVEPPYEFLSQINWGNFPRTADQVAEIIDKSTQVKNGILSEYWFENESGFLAGVIKTIEGDKNYPNPIVAIYDDFSDNQEEPLYEIPVDEILELLEDLKKCL